MDGEIRSQPPCEGRTPYREESPTLGKERKDLSI